MRHRSRACPTNSTRRRRRSSRSTAASAAGFKRSVYRVASPARVPRACTAAPDDSAPAPTWRSAASFFDERRAVRSGARRRHAGQRRRRSRDVLPGAQVRRTRCVYEPARDGPPSPSPRLRGAADAARRTTASASTPTSFAPPRPIRMSGSAILAPRRVVDVVVERAAPAARGRCSARARFRSIWSSPSSRARSSACAVTPRPAGTPPTCCANSAAGRRVGVRVTALPRAGRHSHGRHAASRFSAITDVDGYGCTRVFVSDGGDADRQRRYRQRLRADLRDAPARRHRQRPRPTR